MGAAAGSRLYDFLIKRCQINGAEKDSDFPEVFLHNIPSKGMDEKGISNSEVVKQELLWSVMLLNRCVAEVILIACNSVHVYHKYLQSNSKAEILNMIDIAVEDVGAVEKVGVLSSSSTRNCGLYAAALQARSIEIVQTTDEQQNIVDMIIARVIAGTVNTIDRQ